MHTSQSSFLLLSQSLLADLCQLLPDNVLPNRELSKIQTTCPVTVFAEGTPLFSSPEYRCSDSLITMHKLQANASQVFRKQRF